MVPSSRSSCRSKIDRPETSDLKDQAFKDQNVIQKMSVSNHIFKIRLPKTTDNTETSVSNHIKPRNNPEDRRIRSRGNINVNINIKKWLEYLDILTFQKQI